MTTPLAYLLVVFGALLIAAGCQRPVDVAVKTANAAALSLGAAHSTISAQRRADQEAAARRVVGDRSDPAVRAEQLDRALEVGRGYRPVWDAYDAARAAWVVAVAAIKLAQAAEEAEDEPDMATVSHLLLRLARKMQALEVVTDGR